MAVKTQPDKKRKPGRIKAFFRGVISELKKVHWPDRKQLITFTGVVVMFVLIVSIAISALDWLFSSLTKLVLG